MGSDMLTVSRADMEALLEEAEWFEFADGPSSLPGNPFCRECGGEWRDGPKGEHKPGCKREALFARIREVLKP